MKIQRERVHGLWEEAAAILEAGAADFDPHPEMPLEVDRALYEALEDAGVLRVYTARIEERLVGYAVFVVGRAPRRRYMIEAQQNVVHAERSFAARVTPALVRHAEKALRAENVKMLYHSAPVGCRFGELLEILGYKPIATVHEKLLT